MAGRDRGDAAEKVEVLPARAVIDELAFPLPELDGLVDVLGGFDTALEELKKLLPEKVRDRVVVGLAKTPRQHVPVLDPPEEAGKKAARSMIQALLPDQDRMLFELMASGERVLALGPIVET